MDNPRPVDSPTVHAHKRQLAWQILAPFLVVTALILAVAVLVVTGGVSATRAWADISIIWLIAPMLTLALFLVVLLASLIYGIAKLTQITPRYTGKAQDFFALVSGRTRKIADGSVKPFVWYQQAGAVIKSIFNKS